MYMAHFGTKSELVITGYTSQTCSDFVGSKFMSLRTHRTFSTAPLRCSILHSNCTHVQKSLNKEY